MKKILIFLLISNSYLFSQSKDFESFFRGEEGIQYFIKPLDFKSNNSKSDLSIDFLFLINKNQFTKGSSNFSIVDSQDITFVEIDGKIINLEKIFDENFEKGLLSRYTMELDLIDFIKIFKYSNPIKVKNTYYYPTNKSLKKLEFIFSKLLSRISEKSS